MDRQVRATITAAFATLAEKAPGKLGQPLVAPGLRLLSNDFDVTAKPLFSPVVARRALRAPGVAGARCLEQCFSSGLVVAGVVAGRKRIPFARIAPRSRIFFHERT
jgi:hypothetical protein